MDTGITYKVGWDAATSDILDAAFFAQALIQHESLCVGGKHQEPLRREQLETMPNQQGVIALYIEYTLHALAIGKGRRITKNQIVALAGGRSLQQPLQHIRLNQRVPWTRP